MDNKINSLKIGVVTGTTFLVLSFLCAMSFIIAPVITLNLANSLFHGIDVTQITKTPTFGSVILGLFVSWIIGFVSGWIFAILYKKIK